MSEFLELYLFAFGVMSGLGLFFAIIGLCVVAVHGRKAWTDDATFVVLAFPVVGLVWPVLLLALPFVALYRIVTGR